MSARPIRHLLLLIACAAAPAVSAQMLPSGTWTGTLAGAAGAPHPVEATIERCATGLKVALTLADRTTTTETGAWSRGRLRFQLRGVRVPGARGQGALACTLEQQDTGALSGTCRRGRAAYRLQLAPPAQAAFGCD